VTQTDTRERRSSGPTSEAEEICHIVEPDDPDRALCGKDVTGYPWNPPGRCASSASTSTSRATAETRATPALMRPDDARPARPWQADRLGRDSGLGSRFARGRYESSAGRGSGRAKRAIP
jgi:hypothetical protein